MTLPTDRLSILPYVSPVRAMPASRFRAGAPCCTLLVVITCGRASSDGMPAVPLSLANADAPAASAGEPDARAPDAERGASLSSDAGSPEPAL